MFRHAVVGIDLSKVSKYFVKWLPSLRSIETKRLSLVHVIPLEVVEHVAGFAVDKLLAELRKDALEKLEEYARFLEDTGFVVDFKILGPAIPARKLAEEAERINADYIVVASRGHGWLRDLLLGSTVEELLRISRKPVLVSKPYRHAKGEGAEIRTPPNPFSGSPILAALEFDEYFDSVVSCGVGLSKVSRAELVLLHVVEEGDEGQAKERLERLVKSLAGETSVRYVIGRGRPHKAIVEAVEKLRPGIVLIGGKPGSVLEYVVKRSPVHVFSCK